MSVARSRWTHRRHPLRLSTRLIAGVLALMAVVLVVFGVATITVTRTGLSARLDESVHEALGRAVAFTSFGPVPSAPSGDGLDRDPVDAPGQPAGVLTVVVADDQVITASYRSEDGEARPLPSEDVAVLRSSGVFDPGPPAPGTIERTRDDRRMSTVALTLGEYRVETLTLPPDATATDQLVVSGLPTTLVTGPVDDLVMTIAIGGSLALLTVALGGTFIVRRSLRPLERVSATAADVANLPLASGDVTLLDRHVPPDLARPGTEVGDVGRALNALLGNVESALAARQRSETRLREFVADASHELRTPLAAIRGYTDMLTIAESLSDDERDSLSRIQNQTRRMIALVEDLLLLARIDEAAPATMQRVDLSELMVDALTDASAAGLAHTWRLDVPPQPVHIRADPEQMNRVLDNLLSNARKHTPAGTTITASVRMMDNRAEASIADDGPGIPREFQDQLFDRFSRLDASRHYGEGSTGLGLSIVRSIVESHGGSVTAVSTPGNTVFTLGLPCPNRTDDDLRVNIPVPAPREAPRCSSRSDTVEDHRTDT